MKKKLVTRKTKAVRQAWEKVGKKYFTGDIDSLELFDPTRIDRSSSGNCCYQFGKEIVFGVFPPLFQSGEKWMDCYIYEGSLGTTYAFWCNGETVEPVEELWFDREKIYLTAPGTCDTEECCDAWMIRDGQATAVHYETLRESGAG